MGDMHLVNVHATRKSRFGELDKARLVDRVCLAAVGQNRVLPVLAGGKIIAWVAGERLPSTRVHILEHKPWMLKDLDNLGRICSYSIVDDIIKQCTQNNKYKFTTWHKNMYNGGLATRWGHTWAVAGDPGPGTYGGSARTFLGRSDTTYGALPHGGNVSTDTKHLLFGGIRTAAGTPVIGTGSNVYLLYDMVGSYDSSDFSTSSQNMTNTSAPARYVSSGEPGLQIYPVHTADHPNNVALSALTYTDNNGTSGRAAITTGLQTAFISPGPTVATQWVAAYEYSGSLTVLDIPLRSADSGVRQIDSYQHGSTVTGSLSYVLGYPIAWIPAQGEDWAFAYDFVKQIPSLPIIKDTACLTVAAHMVTLNSMYSGSFGFGWSA